MAVSIPVYGYNIVQTSQGKEAQMPLTLEKIAKLANVSRSTVSRVINGDENVNDATRKRVEEVIRSLLSPADPGDHHNL